MGEQTKNMLIGLFLLSGVALVVFVILFLKPSVGDGKETLYVRFSNINQITVGTRVTFAGKPVGEVVAIQEIHDAREQPTDSLGRVYVYQLVLKVDSSVKVYSTDEVDLQTSGLLGEKSVAIIPRAPPKGVIPKLITNQPIYADSTDPIETAFHQLSSVAGEIESTVKDLHSWILENEDNISYAIKWFGQTMYEAHTAAQTFNEQEIIKSFKAASDNFSVVMNQVQDAMDQLKQEDVFKNVGTTMANFTSASHSIDLITQDLADGKGTIGKLLKNDDLYLRFTAIMSKADTLMNDLNHYGLLFNQNKQWQRLRMQRATLLNALNTPAEFKNYFETEVDQINTAMSRISMLVDKAEGTKTVLDNEGFKKDFAELLREVDALADNLRLYNQKFIELQGN